MNNARPALWGHTYSELRAEAERILLASKRDHHRHIGKHGFTQAKADLDATRKATAQLAFWLTASLLIGAFCASLAATEGGGLRDGTWGSKTRGSMVRRQ